MREKQSSDREQVHSVLDATPLATIAFVRDGHAVALPIGFARLGDELVIHGSTGSPWLRHLAEGSPASVCVTTLEGIMVARSAFESSFRYRSVVLFGSFAPVPDDAKDSYLRALTDVFIPGRSGEVRASTPKELAATLVLRMPIGADNWSLKIGDGWPEDSADDVAAGGWAGVVPIVTTFGRPLRAPDCGDAVPVPASVHGLYPEAID